MFLVSYCFGCFDLWCLSIFPLFLFLLDFLLFLYLLFFWGSAYLSNALQYFFFFIIHKFACLQAIVLQSEGNSLTVFLPGHTTVDSCSSLLLYLRGPVPFNSVVPSISIVLYLSFPLLPSPLVTKYSRLEVQKSSPKYNFFSISFFTWLDQNADQLLRLKCRPPQSSGAYSLSPAHLS